MSLTYVTQNNTVLSDAEPHSCYHNTLGTLSQLLRNLTTHHHRARTGLRPSNKPLQALSHVTYLSLVPSPIQNSTANRANLQALVNSYET